MKKLAVFVAAVAVVGLMSANVLACDGCPAHSKGEVVKAGEKAGCAANAAKSGCGGSANVVQVGEKSGCCAKGAAQAIAACAGKAGCSDIIRCATSTGKCDKFSGCLPVMQYKVGETTTACSKTAKKIAEDGGTMTFVVGDKEYADYGEASKALTAKYDEIGTALTTVRMLVGDESYECPVTAKAKATEAQQKVRFVALRQSFDDRESAEAAVAKARKAAETVAVSYVVDGKKTGCSKTAAECSKEGKNVEYVIGNESTHCNMEAEILTARARLLAMIESVETIPGEQAASL